MLDLLALPVCAGPPRTRRSTCGEPVELLALQIVMFAHCWIRSSCAKSRWRIWSSNVRLLKAVKLTWKHL
jgi:hypothetical protein